MSSLRVAALHSRLAPYFGACVRAFRETSDAEFLTYAWKPATNAPFDPEMTTDFGPVYWREDATVGMVEEQVRAFEPTAVLTSGWIDKGYVQICRCLREKGIPVIAGCDTQWTGSLRQRLAALTARFHLRRAIDVLWVTGARQRKLAEALGYRGDRCWEGYYSCDWPAFAACAPNVGANTERRFLFVGRYVKEKGLDLLVEAYRLYRGAVPDPWKLTCAGRGELQSLVCGEGVEDAGFVQPAELPRLMASASAFVLPSRFEPWGVVIHEAAAAGLPLIVSKACGAGDHLVRDGSNGLLTTTGSVGGLAAALARMHRLSVAERREFGVRSSDLSKQYTPDRWARTLVEGVARLRKEKRP